MLNIYQYTLMVFLISLINISSVQANNDALVRAQYMIRQINAELNQLKSVNEKLKIDNIEISKNNKILNKKYISLDKKNNNNNKKLSGKIENIKNKYKDELISHNETRKTLSERTIQIEELMSLSDMQKNKLNICIVNNNKLYEINKDVFKRYEDKGMWDSFSQSEPFSQLSQVEIENLVDDYQYMIDDLHIELN